MATGNVFSFAAIDGVVDTAVRVHGPSFLDRGGPLNRAFSEILRGAIPADAAAIAARQGKGHIGELRLSRNTRLEAACSGARS